MVRIATFRKVLLIGLVSFLIFTQVGPVSAGASVWTSLGPADAVITAIAINPNTPSTLYIGTYSSGVKKSTNSGGSWSSVNTGLTDTYVTSLVIDPIAPNTLYVGTWGGVFKSTNGGATWSEVNTGLYSLLITALAINPKNPSMIYAGNYYGGLYKSTNGGSNWEKVSSYSGYVGQVKAIAINPKTPNTLYVANQLSVVRTMDGGGTWQYADIGLTVHDTNSLVINPKNPSTLYVGKFASDSVYKSINSAESWHRADSGLNNHYVYSLAINPNNPNTLYAGTNSGGVFKSTNAGGSWVAINTGLPTGKTVYVLAISPTNPAKLYAGTSDNGVYVIHFPVAYKTLTYPSTSLQDGWILESTEISNTGGTKNSTASVLILGDNAQDRQYRSILSFNTASLPENAVITKVTLKLKLQGKVGTNPFITHGNLLVDIKKGTFSGIAALQLADFRAGASKNLIGTIPNTPVNSWYKKTWTGGILPYINKAGITQLRLRFSKDDNDDMSADYLKFYSGNADTTVRPQLIIEYYEP